MATAKILQRLYSLNTSSPDFTRYLSHLIQSDKEDPYLLGLQGSELTRLVDFLDTALTIIPTADDVSRSCLHKLQAICSHHGILPSSHIIAGGLTKVGDYPVASGGFADVWEGVHDKTKVCIKCPRINTRDRQDIEKAFYKEATIWKRFKHQNIVPFIGVTRDPLQFVSEWMPNGTLTQYLGKNRDASRVDLLLDVAEGLAYLHAKHATHGDLKGLNILIDNDGRARLTDFGFASVVRGLNSALVSSVRGYTPGWAAPEVIKGNCVSTTEADVYAFGIVVVEAFTGSHPFNEFAPAAAVFKMVIQREMPDRPQEKDLTDPVWEMTVRCWEHEPGRRPRMTEVVSTLRECHRSLISAAQLSTNLEPPAPSSSRGLLVSDGPRTTDPGLPAPPWLRSTRPPGFEDARGRIDEVAEVLAAGRHESRHEGILELLRLCSNWCTVPTSYELKDVEMSQWDILGFNTCYIVKGRYTGTAVRRVVCTHQTPTDAFCEKVVLLKQLEHDNIAPFFGVFAEVAGFSKVFPWYKNGHIMNYLEKNPDVDQYNLLLGAVRGLQFLHESFIVHGALEPSLVLIDDYGNARLSIEIDGSIVVVPGTPFAEYLPSPLKRGLCCYRYLAPEIQWPEAYGTDKIPVMKESDIYGMAVVIYEVLAGIKPYCNCNDYGGVQNTVQVWGIPERILGAFTDPMWGLLVECWSKVPARRPPLVELYNALSLSNYRTPPTPQKMRLILVFFSIAPSPAAGPTVGHRFYAKFKYGENIFRSPWTHFVLELGASASWDWQHPNWLIDINRGDYAQSVSVEVFISGGQYIWGERLWATGNFSLGNCEVDKMFNVKLVGREGGGDGYLSMGLTAKPL